MKRKRLLLSAGKDSAHMGGKKVPKIEIKGKELVFHNVPTDARKKITEEILREKYSPDIYNEAAKALIKWREGDEINVRGCLFSKKEGAPKFRGYSE